jgi:molybdopterin molybdotransferase
LDRLADGTFEATPLFGKSNLIFTLVRADGLIEIPLDLGGAAVGARVRVILP